MISSITNYLFGAAEEYGKCAELQSSVPLRTTPAEDEWLLVDTCADDSNNVDSSPLENLLIEHPSMSVYQSPIAKSTGNTSSSRQCQEPVPAKRTSVRAAVACNRTEPYNLRKSTVQKSKSSRKLTSAKAFQQHNKVYNRNNRQVFSRPVVFQPRK